MEDSSHLEKMGGELKCPICLSLLNSAVSLACNHVFCNSCIIKSMKSGSNCPVCKLPYRRREVRAAPHMDNLVSIYKSMEVASGISIFVTQNVPSNEQTQVEEDSTFGKEDNGKLCQNRVQNQQRSKRKCSRKNTESSVHAAKPSFPAKKRVQVPQNLLAETPSRPEKPENGSIENIKGGFKNSLVTLNGKPGVYEKNKVVLPPFFWLRDEDSEKLSQHTDEDPLLDITPPNIPSFSDIKGTDDEHTDELLPTEGICVESNAADLFDSEMFEWTQRACSPEIFPSPLKLQVEDTEEIQRFQEGISELSLNSNTNVGASIENGKYGNNKGMGVADEALPAASPRRVKRGTNSRKATLKKCGKKNSNQDFKVAVNSETELGNLGQKEAIEKRESTLNLKRRAKKPGLVTCAAELPAKTVLSVSPTAETLNPHDRKMDAESAAPLIKKQGDKRNNRKASGKLSTESKTDRTLRSNKRKRCSTEINMINEVNMIQNEMDENSCPQLTLSTAPTVDNVNICAPGEKSSKHVNDGKSLVSSESSKHIKVSFHGISECGFANDHQDPYSNMSARETDIGQETQPSEKLQYIHNGRVLNNSGPSQKHCETNGAHFGKCDTPSTHKIQCVFCLSSDDSEASGEMVHYLHGRPVAADYNGGSLVIHTHKNCAEWAPNVYFENDHAINLEAELARSRRIKCCCCGRKGAALGCYERCCRKSFHVSCAKLTPQCRWDTDNFVMLCPLHASSKLPNEHSGSHEQRKKYMPNRKTRNQIDQVPRHNVSACQSWNSGVTPDKLVLCCSALRNEEKEIISTFKQLSGATVLKNWDLNVTHVIASTDENGACKRTLKVLMAILEGKWVLSSEWVKACVKATKLVEEKQFEISVDTQGMRDGPLHGRLRVLNKQPKVLEGLKFYLMGDFVPSYKGYVQDLLKAAGATILHRKPISGTQDNLSLAPSSCSTFIIYSLELPDRCNPSEKKAILSRRRCEAEALASSTGAKAVSNSWVLNSIAACNLQHIPE